MKLIRFGPSGFARPGIIDEDGIRRDISEFGEDFGESFFGKDGIGRLRKWLKTNQKHLPEIPNSARLGPPVSRPSKLVCIGLNYAEHAREIGLAHPSEPAIFFKSTSALCGPNDPLILPKNSKKTDWEVELAFVISKKAYYVKESEALDYIAGYTIMIDYSERENQMDRGGQWVKGKSSNNFAPLGPYLLTNDELDSSNGLVLWLKVNEKEMQRGSTSDMIFKVPFVLHYISQFMTLLPGDIISTGTPSGVGMGRTPPVFLKEGDVVEYGIDKLGTAKQKVKAFK